MSTRLTDPEQLRELLGIPFTPEQLACITAPAAPQVVVAGAGSGKTTVMAARVVWLVGTGRVAPEQVLGLTFTNKAAGELAERVRAALVRAGITDPDPAPDPAVPADAGDGGEAVQGEPQILTYHAFAGRLLAEHGLRLGVEPGARLLADATRFQLAARVLAAAPGPFEGLRNALSTHVQDLLALDSELSEHLVPPERLREYDTRLREDLAAAEAAGRLTNQELRRIPGTALARTELLGLVEEYRARKRERDLLDFGDRMALSAVLARDVPEVGRLLRREFAVVLLDEYQDTSVAQRVLLSGLFGGGPAGDAPREGAGHPVTAVGDPCQGIYGWRGASVANLDDFPEHFPHADGRPADRLSLSENRRSGGRLLHLANRLAAPLRERHAGVRPLRPAPGAEHDGVVRCALLPTHAEELEWLADSVAHLVRTGTPPGEVAVLCRTAGDFAELQRVLVAREVPVEVVGLSGLLHLPEVADLVAMCEVLQDPTANAPLVRLLTGPRWRVGPRDLALLGRRARLLVRREETADDDPERRLAAAVEGVDPAEVISLADALDTFLESEGHDDELPFSAEARVRFARLATEIRELRRSLGDPLMDVLHRVLAATGLEVELAASPQALAARRRETLGAFLDVAAGFASLDGEATLLAFLGFLRTAAQYDKGLDSSLPGGEDTVKVLTAHKAKGLEWDVVALPGLVAKQFPSEQPRESWLTRPGVLPHPLRGDAATLPALEEWSARALREYDTRQRDHQALEELRLGYVAFTRARSLLLGSGHWWGPRQKRPRGPSAFLEALREHCAEHPAHGEVEAWAGPPEQGAENPALAEPAEERAWPLPLDPAALARRRAAAARVLAHLDGPGEAPGSPRGEVPGDEASGDVPGCAAEDAAEDGVAAGHRAAGHEPPGHSAGYAHPGHPAGHAPPGQAPAPRARCGPVPGPRRTGEGTKARDHAAGEEPAAPEPVTPEEARLVASWDRDLDALAGELRRSRSAVREVPLPPSLTASQLLRLAADPEGFARELARPMPRPPQPAAARRGTRFHAWVESRFEELTLPMLGPDELPGADDEDAGGAHGAAPPQIADERDLAALKEAFARTPYAHRTPYRVEAPFQLELAGRLVRGRIDAVYRERGPDGGTVWEIVDWKTGRGRDADPLQLAVYRVAWAEQQGVPLSAVGAAFLHVRSGELVRPEGLPDREGLERLLLGEQPPDGPEPPGAREAADGPDAPHGPDE
ncbi:ATP-dependent DNA helicase [Streptomyces sp. JJ36]|uniref:ATP-dependent DNA helicase n=1 Tax=Streptomyces sp. JJ36 TaxID=2736645 RepID=UPI001F022602|nr:ATP-dependent DNA helicase [Streptomyces sp. JJ36]MCF6523482.1 UvrD-helicase domain-containing protein [Streptomyces sp. JJ36]